MVTGTQEEKWFAVVAFFICFFVFREVDEVFEKFENSRIGIQLATIFFIGIAGYTTINGIVYFASILDVWIYLMGGIDTAGEVADRKIGGFALLFTILWPLVSIVFGATTCVLFFKKYRDTSL